MIVSVHEYELVESADAGDFSDVVTEAIDRGLFDRVPGLVEYHLGRGIKGDRTGKFVGVWMYENRDVWSDLWGPVTDPVPKSEYPDAWLVWEDELLDPILAEDPDRISYTSYELVAAGTGYSDE